MRISTFVAGVLGAALMTSTAFAGEVTLYTWRIQEQPLWDYINANKVLGDTTVKVVVVNSDTTSEDAASRCSRRASICSRAGPAPPGSKPYIDAGIVKPTTTDLSGIAPAHARRRPRPRWQALRRAVRGADGRLHLQHQGVRR